MHTLELQARRLIAQALAPSAARTASPINISEAARYMLATQGQNYAGGLTALAIRCGMGETPIASNTSHLDDVLSKYDVIRTWSQRGTLHFLHREDYWLITLLGKRILTTSPARLAERLEISEKDYEKSLRLINESCTEQRSRSDLYALYEKAGYDKRVLAHHLRRMGSSGKIIQGQKAGQHDTFIHAQQAIPDDVLRAEHMTEHDKQREVVLRYFSTRGPATIPDLQWWSSLPQGQIKKHARALTDSGELLAFSDNDRTYYMAGWQKNVTHSELEAALKVSHTLPAFDEFFIAYTDRTHIFADGIDPHTVMTKNGISWPFRMEKGRIQGRAS